MTKQCQICRESVDNLQLVVYHKGANTKSGYLVMDDQVVFDPAKLSKFLYYCESRGLHCRVHGVLDLCLDCLRGARIGMN